MTAMCAGGNEEAGGGAAASLPWRWPAGNVNTW